ncbi:MAG: hypothetical protein RL557_784 [archaeon]|jgi:regulator of protease activity HflC (stomatin/prohibitin superfamily)
MKVIVGGQEYEYNKERYLEGLIRNFPMPGEPKAKSEKDRVKEKYESKGFMGKFFDRLRGDFFGLRNYPKDESEFTTPLIKIFTVPEGYTVTYKIGGKVRGKRPVRGAGYHLMIGLAGLLESAHVIGIRPRVQDLIIENVVTADGVPLSKVDARLFYQVEHPERTLGVQDYHELTFGAAEERIADYVGDHKFKELFKGKDKKMNLIYDDNGNPLSFSTVENAGVKMLELLVIDVPLDEPTKRLLEIEAAGEAQKQSRILNAQAEYVEIIQRGKAVAEVGAEIQNIPGAIFLRTLETYDEFAQGPNNTIVTVPEIPLNIKVQQEKAQGN